MNYKDFWADEHGKVTHIVWEDGSKSKVPFHIEYTLQDFNGDRQEYLNYCVRRTQQYEHERAVASDVSEPVRSMYPTEEVFESNHKQWERTQNEEGVERATEKAMAKVMWARDQALRPPPKVYDEYEVERRQNLADQNVWIQKLMDAIRNRDQDQISRCDDQIKWLKRDFEKIPISVEMEQKVGDIQRFWTENIELLEGKRKDPGIDWSNPVVQAEYEEKLRNYNKFTGGTIVALPIETGRCSRAYEPIRPGNVKIINLPTEKMKEEFNYHVYQCGRDPHDEIRGMGYGHLLEPTPAPEPELIEGEEPSFREEKPKPPETDPVKMDQKTFEAYREAQEQAKRQARFPGVEEQPKAEEKSEE